MRGYKNFEANPHPGSLRHLVEIGYTENAINENGFPEPTDHVLCKAWAAVTDAGNQHYRSADVMNTEAVLHHKWCNNGRDEYWVCSTNIKKRASSCKGIFLPSSVADSWNIEAPVVVQRFKDENGMVQFTAYPKDEYEAMKGE